MTPAAASEARAAELVLRDAVTGDVHRVVPRRLVVAGFTGRDPEAVAHHVEELRAFGAVVPETVPVFLTLDPGLVTAAESITVVGAFTSGEVEAVVVVTAGQWLLAAGSDHTDRDLERESLRRSKEACPKVVGPDCLPLETVRDLDRAELRSWVDGEQAPYQAGSLGDLLPLPEIMRLLEADGITLRDGDVLFLGTVPVTGGGLRPAGRFRGSVRVPDLAVELAVDYLVEVTPS